MMTEMETLDFKLEINEMAKAGLHFGHSVSKVHPKMLPYLAGVRNAIHIIDLEKTKEKLEEALKFIYQLVKENKIILFVGTKIQVRDLVKEIALATGFPYVNQRWLGGTFTNFDVIRKRVEYMKELELKLKDPQIRSKYTKKEINLLKEKLEKLKLKFDGIRNLERIPDAIFVIDMVRDYLAIKEARKKGVKVVAISDSNSNPTLADYFIPANDDAIFSVKYILDKVKEAILKAKGK